MTRPVGWRREPARHALAAKGISIKAAPRYVPPAMTYDKPDVTPLQKELTLRKWVQGLKKLNSEDWSNYSSVMVFGSALDEDLWNRHYQEWLEGKRTGPPDIDIAVEVTEYDLYQQYRTHFEGTYAVAHELDGSIRDLLENSIDDDDQNDDGPAVDLWFVAPRTHLNQSDDYVESVGRLDMTGATEIGDWIAEFNL